MFRPEPLDIVLIVLVAALLFGANRIPETARAIGKAIHEFRDAVAGKDTTEPIKESQHKESEKIENHIG